MDALLLAVVPLVGFLIAYQLYGKFLARRIFKLDDQRPVPSHELSDGVDYVPTRKGIIFGHHYTSIAGTGPIVGPAIGIIWGWVPALIWVFVGSIFMGAVHDFGALVISLRNQGKSLSEVAGRYVNRRVRTIFFLIVFFELWIVIAVFAMVIAIVFRRYPQSVFPIWMEVPIALGLGYAIYKKSANVKLATLVAVVAMYVTVVLGHWLPIHMPDLGAMPAMGAWAVLLLGYAFVASTLPVTTLLQPRDYINAWQLFIAMGLLLLGVLTATGAGSLHIAAPALNLQPEGAPAMWPFLFVVIACGAISGFHSLVASGTTPKQVSREGDALFVGYGSMLMEGALAALVIVAVAAGIGIAYKTGDGSVLRGQQAWMAHYSSWGAAAGLGSKLDAFVFGSANMMGSFGIPVALGVIIMGVFVASFAGTTLDTATRIQRYVINELGQDFRPLGFLKNRYLATGIAVGSAALLAFWTGASGKGALVLWPMFGAVNQLLASLALLVVTIYLRRRTRFGWLVTAVPMLFMLVMTHHAVALNEINFIRDFQATGEKLHLIVINATVQLLAVWMTIEAFIAFFVGAEPEQAPEAVAEPAE
ncbi:MAG: carbon starvation protein A [Candidatus Brocadiia bacterium]